jgi:hypothetical protein
MVYSNNLWDYFDRVVDEGHTVTVRLTSAADNILFPPALALESHHAHASWCHDARRQLLLDLHRHTNDESKQ